MGIQKIVGLTDERRDFPARELIKCRVNGIDVINGVSFYEMLTGKLLVDHIKPQWLIYSKGFRQSHLRRVVKRLNDLCFSLAMLIALSPLIVLAAVLIKLDTREPEPSPMELWRYFGKICAREKMPVSAKIVAIIKEYLGGSPMSGAHDVWRRFRTGCELENVASPERLLSLVKAFIEKVDCPAKKSRPVFFSQERMGKDRRVYRILKFRSMVVNAEKYSGPVWAGENDKRITRIGYFIRKWRIDEIPQLWNVLKGEMSFVGPRPEREFFIKQLEKTIPYYGERFAVKPGLTGWAQVSYGYGASENDAKEKLNYDFFYIKNMSIAMDMMIVMKTVKIVIFGKGR